MGKTNSTKTLETKIWEATQKNGLFACHEVTIGINGNERVDYITVDTKGIWRCYEIKVSKADFQSDAKHSFVGHYNYYVMPNELFEQVKAEIPDCVGVHNGDYVLKNAKKQELKVNENILKDSMIRSLHREYSKTISSENKEVLQNLKTKVSKLENQIAREKRAQNELESKLREKYGRHWHHFD